MGYITSLLRSISAVSPTKASAVFAGNRDIVHLGSLKIVDLIIFERLLHGGSGHVENIASALIAGTMPEQGLTTDRPMVFACRERGSNQRAVVKLLQKSSFSQQARENWPQVCKKILNLPYHPLVLTIYAIYEDAERYYVISEELTGSELYHFLLKEISVPEELCKHLIRQILLSLEFLEASRILHRDVKPENLMFRQKPHTKVASGTKRPHMQQLLDAYELVLIDLDTAKFQLNASEDAQARKGSRRRLVGTYNYMAPELLCGAEHSPTSDLWSVGVILYILMTGIPPLPMNQMHTYESTLASLRTANQTGGINFDEYPLNRFPAAKDLCQQLLKFDPQQRLKCARIALQHPWLSSSAFLSAPYYMASAVEMPNWSEQAQRARQTALYTMPRELAQSSRFTLPVPIGRLKKQPMLPGTPTQKLRNLHDLSAVSTRLTTGSDVSDFSLDRENDDSYNWRDSGL